MSSSFRPKSLRVPVTVIATLVMVVAGTACGTGGWLSDSPAARSADQHATVAGEVMQRYNWERSANDAAYMVVGSGADDTIDAVDVEGTTYHGKVVLRITVQDSSEFGGGPVTKCYAYTFRHQMGDEKPSDVPCTDRIVVLTPPVPEPDFDQAASAKLTAVLRRLVALHTTDSGTIQRQVAAEFGPPVSVSVGPTGLDHGRSDGSLIVNLTVPSQWECMWAIVSPAGKVTTGTGNRRTCAN